MTYTHAQYIEDMKQPASRYSTFDQLRQSFFQKETLRTRAKERKVILQTVGLIILDIVLVSLLYYKLASF